MRRRRDRRSARGAWVAAFVVVALIGALAASQFGLGTSGSGAGTSTVTGTVVATGTSTAAPSAGAAGSASTASATASAPAAATATATAGAGMETGGPLVPVRQYFAALAAGSYPAAYALLAPSYRSAHSLAAFVTALPPQAPSLTAATISSVANFHATVKVTLAPVGGGAPVTESVQLVDANATVKGTNAAKWMLAAPPAGAGG